MWCDHNMIDSKDSYIIGGLWFLINFLLILPVLIQ